MCKKFSELSYNGVYANSNENRQAIIGNFLISLGINLEKIPKNFFEPFSYYPSKKASKKSLQKIYLQDVVGTCRKEYAEDNQVIFSFMKLKRITYYIQANAITRYKYSRDLKKANQELFVTVSRNPDGTFFVDGNGNHRILAYKILMLSEIAKKYPWVYQDDYELSFKGFTDITKKYWLYALVKD